MSKWSRITATPLRNDSFSPQGGSSFAALQGGGECQMSKNSSTPSTTDSTRRSQYRQQLTVAWMKRNKPEVYKAIEEFAATKFPYSENSGVPASTVLPPELANLR